MFIKTIHIGKATTEESFSTRFCTLNILSIYTLPTSVFVKFASLALDSTHGKSLKTT